MSRVACPHCSTELENPPEFAGRIVSCPICSGQIQMPVAPPPVAKVYEAPREVPRRPYRPPPGPSGTQVLTAALVLLVFGAPAVFMFICCGGCINTIEKAGQQAASSSTTSKRSPSSGDIVTINNGANKVILATDTESLDRLTKLSNAGDTEGALGLVLAGRAFVVDSGVSARIIDPGIFSSEVRILEGDQYGKSGWLPVEFIIAKTK